jgi:hypothetical protein
VGLECAIAPCKQQGKDELCIACIGVLGDCGILEERISFADQQVFQTNDQD